MHLAGVGKRLARRQWKVGLWVGGVGYWILGRCLDGVGVGWGWGGKVERCVLCGCGDVRLWCARLLV